MDRFPIEIRFGGEMTAGILRELVVTADMSGFGVNWETPQSVDDTMAKLLKQLTENNGRAKYLELTGEELAFESEIPVGEEMTKRDIPYNAVTGPMGDYGPSMSWWRPGMKKNRDWCFFTGEAEVLISLQQLKEWRKKRRGLADVISYLEKIPPPLPEFVLTDWSPGLDPAAKQVTEPSPPPIGGVHEAVDTP